MTRLDSDVDVKLGGFALAMAEPDIAKLKVENLTVSVYSAPEIVAKTAYGMSHVLSFVESTLNGLNHASYCGRIGRAVDMWSIGVVLYILLGGYPPFHDENEQVQYRNIAEGNFVFHAEYWGNVSAHAKDLIKNLLCVDPHQRFTVQQAMQHPWIGMVPTAAAMATKMELPTTEVVDTMKDVPRSIHDIYRVGEIVGSGGMSVVKQGQNLIDNSIVAVKVVDRTKLDDFGEQSMRDEIDILLSLNHPNIVRGLDFFEETESFYVIMELIKGNRSRVVQCLLFHLSFDMLLFENRIAIKYSINQSICRLIMHNITQQINEPLTHL